MGLTATHGEALRLVLGRLAMVEMTRPLLSRALEPFPLAVRTLDALHLATVDFLSSQNQKIELATYDQRMLEAAEEIGVAIFELP